MGAEKHGSKSGGGYVGGLLQLFDWNAKSRKKLFSSKSTIPEQSKQKKRYDGNLPMTRLALLHMDEDEMVTRSSIKGSSDYSCASSVTDDEFGGARAPGVVARLMGLDSMPTSNFPEPYSTPYFDSQSLQDAHYHSRNVEGNSHCRLHHSGNLREKMEAPVKNVLELKNSKITNRPIEKFQTEILPPKSAKSIPITHHKLLSPIKSANFIPSENAAQIMEAAARIIGPGPRGTTISKAKVPIVGSSSVPIKVRDLKEKVEAAQKPSRFGETSRRPGESNALKYLKGQSMNKSWNGSADTISARLSSDAEECLSSTKGKGKSISLALQAKANVQKREGINPSGSRNLVAQKELNEVIFTELFKSQSSTRKSTQKKSSTLGTSNVLRQNNQKQNCLADRGKLPSKPSTSSSQGRKPVNGDSSLVRCRSSSKSAGSSKGVLRRSSNSEVLDGKKEDSYSSSRNITRKKRSIDGNFHLEKTCSADKMWNNKGERLIQSSISTDKEANKRKGTDVISFTFTAPMTRLVTGTETSREVAEKSSVSSADYRSKGSLFNPADVNSTKFSLLGNNVIGGDALSTLLEQKLRELTHAVETSLNKAGNSGYSPSVFQDMRPGVDPSSSLSSLDEYRTQDQMQTDEAVSKFSSGFSSTDLQGFIMKHKFQGMDHEMNRYRRNDTEAKKLFDCRLPSPVSVLEHSPFAESCNSSDTADSISTGGSKQSSSVQAQEVFGVGSSRNFHPLEAEAELSDSASSLSTRTVAAKQLITLTSMEPGESTKWELEYVNEILCNVELMFKDFAMDRAREIINPHLFDQLESRKWVYGGDESKLRRKALFDCVTESLDNRCRRYAGGGYETWVKGLSVVRSRERLAEEVYREISGWSCMGDSMVDELIDKDMSNKCGRWLDFEIEVFELGVQIENRILNHLLDEVLADIL